MVDDLVTEHFIFNILSGNNETVSQYFEIS